MKSFIVFTDIKVYWGNGQSGHSFISTAQTVDKVLKAANECYPDAVVMRILESHSKKEVYRKPHGAPSHNSWHN